MSLEDEYKRQFRWRDWHTILDALPLAPGQTILDLGCGLPGDARFRTVEDANG
jgi:cyclopropane fatty-acyl-phospholipid synthase-like methyltransferase